MKRWLLGAVCLASLQALDTSKLKPQGHANDFSGTLDAAARGQMESYCAQLEQKTGAQMEIVLVKTLDDEPIADVTTRLFREWEIGKKNADQGVLLLLAVDDQKEDAEVGDGLAQAVSANRARIVLSDERPTLHLDSHGEAVFAVVQNIGARIAKAKSVTLDQPATKSKGSWFGPAAIILYICIAAFIAGLAVAIPSIAKAVWQTFLSPTTWYILIAVAALTVIFIFIGHDRAARIFGSNIVDFFENGWPVLAMVLAFVLFASRGNPLNLVLGSGNRRKNRSD